MYDLSNFDHLLGAVLQTKVSGGNGMHDSHAKRTNLCCYGNVVLKMINKCYKNKNNKLVYMINE